MQTYIFHEGSLPAGTALDYEPAIFNMPAFRSLQYSGSGLSFYLLRPSGMIAMAGIHFYKEGKRAQTPFKAPFGSLECSENINPRFLYRFLEFVELRLKAKGVAEIYIKNPPRAYSPTKWSLVETFLLNQNYVIAEAEVSAVISIEEKPFTEGIRHSEKLRQRQGKEAGFRFEKLSTDRLPEVYQFISDCHLEKGYKLNITEAELRSVVHAFPDSFLLFAVFLKESIVAASVGIRINRKILYNFLANHEKLFNNLSPPILLIEGMYDYCRENSISLLDLGTSALKGKPNFSLLDFKLHIGGLPTSKFSFHKELSK